ncbi:HD domain-containing protein [Effusibacillus lacus]|uniref:HAD family hydrolase n=1 Tax=Effusibacillus lacus TaxID=1348429 RepID=A0A292YJP2_9BACL|nr:HD domain-containing protein [Effusibacillus lacus]TCS77000.1 metal dependent phosphohydrolase [Effusibacillus lacus]GAX91327.1 HAD family hydrolase [Effusibacillus lacus]
MNFTREEAWNLLNEYTKSQSLIKHALAVETSIRAYAAKFGEDVEKWGIVGLLHDFDYEMYPTPEEHPFKGCEILQKMGYPEDVIHAILSHAEYSGVPRVSLLDKTLFAVDELSGFVMAVALVRPTKSIFDVDVKAVRKKLKDKAFAKGVSREDVYKGAEELGVDLDEHIEFVIAALQARADELGLRGIALEA